MKKLTSLILTALLVLSLCVCASAADLTEVTVPAEGLHFSFDKTTADDTGAVTGTAADGVVYTEDRNGSAESAIQFNGTEQYVAYNLSPITGDWTCNTWIRVDKMSDWAFLWMSYDYSLRPLQNSGYDGQIGYSNMAANGANYGFDTAPALTVGQWTMLTFCSDQEAKLTKVFVNGEYTGQCEAFMPLGLELLGNDNADCRGWMVDSGMTLDDMTIYAGVLSDADIKTLYTDGKIAAPTFTHYEKPTAQIPEDSFVLPVNGIHFTFDDTLDSTDGLLTGTAFGNVTYEKGHSNDTGKAVNFTGADTYAKYGQNAAWGNWTCSTWIRIDEISTWDFLWMDHVYSLRPLQNSDCGAVLNEIGASTCNVAGKSDINEHFDDCYLELEEWTMLTYVGDMDNESLSVYVNDEFRGVIEGYYLPLALDLMGNDCAENCGWMIDSSMVLDDMWLFGRCLSAEEVETLYADGAIAAVAEPAAAEAPVEEAPVEEAPAEEAPVEEAVEEVVEEAPVEEEAEEIVVEEAEVVEEEPEAVPAAEEPADAAPQTSDASLILAAVLVASLSAAGVFKKEKLF